MYTRLIFNALLVFLIFCANITVEANILTVENKTEYFIWIMDVEYSGPFWTHRTYHPYDMQPIPPGGTIRNDAGKYPVGAYTQTAIERIYVSRDRNEDPAKNKRLNTKARLQENYKVQDWRPFLEEDIEAKRSNTPVFTIASTRIDQGYNNFPDWKVTITQTNEPLEMKTIVPRPKSEEKPNPGYAENAISYQANDFRFKNDSKYSIKVTLTDINRKFGLSPGQLSERKQESIKPEERGLAKVNFTVEFDHSEPVKFFIPKNIKEKIKQVFPVTHHNGDESSDVVVEITPGYYKFEGYTYYKIGVNYNIDIQIINTRSIREK